jgi:hypothetical protein
MHSLPPPKPDDLRQIKEAVKTTMGNLRRLDQLLSEMERTLAGETRFPMPPSELTKPERV